MIVEAAGFDLAHFTGGVGEGAHTLIHRTDVSPQGAQRYVVLEAVEQLMKAWQDPQSPMREREAARIELLETIVRL